MFTAFRHLAYCFAAVTALTTSSFLYAQEPEDDSGWLSNCPPSDCFWYVKLGGGGIEIHKRWGAAIGVGRRFECEGAAIDISANWTGAEGSTSSSRSWYWSAPRALYLIYDDPFCDRSWYYGPGISWGQVSRRDGHKKMLGIFIDGAVGYEVMRDSAIRAFAQLDISQPILSATKRGSLPGPLIMLSAGVGF